MPPATRVWCECCQKSVPPSTEYRHRKGRARPHVRATYIYKKSLLRNAEDGVLQEMEVEPLLPVYREQDGDVGMEDEAEGMFVVLSLTLDCADVVLVELHEPGERLGSPGPNVDREAVTEDAAARICGRIWAGHATRQVFVEEVDEDEPDQENSDVGGDTEAFDEDDGR